MIIITKKTNEGSAKHPLRLAWLYRMEKISFLFATTNVARTLTGTNKESKRPCSEIEDHNLLNGASCDDCYRLSDGINCPQNAQLTISCENKGEPAVVIQDDGKGWDKTGC